MNLRQSLRLVIGDVLCPPVNRGIAIMGQWVTYPHRNIRRSAHGYGLSYV